MLRTYLSVAVVTILTLVMAAAGQNAKDKTGQNAKEKAGKGQQATITKVDAKSQSVTVKMKDKSGKEVEKTFKLTEDIRYFDSTGKAAAIDVFQSGDDILVITAEGTLKEVHRRGQTSAVRSDHDFLKLAAEIDQAEIKLGKLAQEHAASAALKKFGERMVADHSKMNKSLLEIAKTQKLSSTQQLDKKHQELCEQLSKLKGAEFDRAFVNHMVSGHEKALQCFEAEAKNGQDPNVKAWAEKWVPTLREHLKLAKETMKEVQK